MGEEAFLDALPRDFARLMAAHRRKLEREVETILRHITLPVLNHQRDTMNVIIGVMTGKKGKIKPLTPSDVGLPDRNGPERRGPMSREAYEEMKAHFRYLREHGTRTSLN